MLRNLKRGGIVGVSRLGHRPPEGLFRPVLEKRDVADLRYIPPPPPPPASAYGCYFISFRRLIHSNLVVGNRALHVHTSLSAMQGKEDIFTASFYVLG